MLDARRSFLKFLASLPFAGTAWLARTEPAKRLELSEFTVAGLRFHAPPALLQRMRPGEPVEVHEERDNPYDQFAVLVRYRGRQIGYMPRNQNRTVSLLLRQDVPVDGVITLADPDAVPWRAVRVRLTMRGPASKS